MAGGKQTPRQKLIGLMYLIFISLMALNVDVSVMDSFVLIDEGIKETNVHYTKRIDDIMRDFEFQDSLAPERVRSYYDNAQKITELSDNLIDTILFFRTDMIAGLDRIDKEVADTMSLRDLRVRSQYSRSSHYWLIEGKDAMAPDGGAGSRAYLLLNMMEEYIEEVTRLAVELVPEEHQEEFLKNFDLGINIAGPFYNMSGEEVSWQRAMFDRVIPIAVATNLSRLVTEVRNATLEATSKLYALIDAETFRFDRIEAKVVPRSRIVMQGDFFEADVLVAAYDTRQNPEIVVDGSPIEVTEGVGRLRILAGTIGSRTIRGEIRVPDPATGITRNYPFEQEYTVQQQAVTVAADAMNVFFIGPENPVSISVPGVPSENIRATISRGRLVPRGGGRFDAIIPEGTSVRENVRINVTAVLDGTPRNIGHSEFRVRNVPNPVATIAGARAGGSVPAVRLSTGQPRLSAAMDDFYFDLSFTIESYEVIYRDRRGDVRRFNVSGSNLSQDVMSVMQGARRGEVVAFENIRARGPDGMRTLDGMYINIE